MSLATFKESEYDIYIYARNRKQSARSVVSKFLSVFLFLKVNKWTHLKNNESTVRRRCHLPDEPLEKLIVILHPVKESVPLVRLQGMQSVLLAGRVGSTPLGAIVQVGLRQVQVVSLVIYDSLQSNKKVIRRDNQKSSEWFFLIPTTKKCQ